MNYLRNLRTYTLALLGFFLLIPIPSLIFWPFSYRVRKTVLHKLWNIYFKYLVGPVFKTHFYFEDRRTSEDQDLPWRGLYIANHQSMMDIPVLMSHFTIPALMKEELMRVPLFGWSTWVSGCIPVKRHDRHSRKDALIKCQERLTENEAIQYYPEGTRSKLGRPKDFADVHKSLLNFAYQNNIPVTPLSLFGTPDVLEKGGGIRLGVQLGLICHPVLRPKDFAQEEDFAKKGWEMVVSGFQELQEKLRTGRSS